MVCIKINGLVCSGKDNEVCGGKVLFFKRRLGSVRSSLLNICFIYQECNERFDSDSLLTVSAVTSSSTNLLELGNIYWHCKSRLQNGSGVVFWGVFVLESIRSFWILKVWRYLMWILKNMLKSYVFDKEF